jgi:hypothetical protein
VAAFRGARLNPISPRTPPSISAPPTSRLTARRSNLCRNAWLSSRWMPLPFHPSRAAAAAFRGASICPSRTPPSTSAQRRDLRRSGKAIKPLTQSLAFIGPDAAADWPSRLRWRRSQGCEVSWLTPSHPPSISSPPTERESAGATSDQIFDAKQGLLSGRMPLPFWPMRRHSGVRETPLPRTPPISFAIQLACVFSR